MPIRTWEGMRTSIADRLLRQTGHDLDWWNARIVAEGEVVDEAALRGWLTENGVTGYQQMLLVMERFGYPDYLLASAEELLDGQYRDRPQLRPILDAVLAVAGTFGPIDVQARKTYTTLMTPRRTFAAVKPATRTRVDLAASSSRSSTDASAIRRLMPPPAVVLPSRSRPPGSTPSRRAAPTTPASDPGSLTCGKSRRSSPRISNCQPSIPVSAG